MCVWYSLGSDVRGVMQVGVRLKGRLQEGVEEVLVC